MARLVDTSRIGLRISGFPPLDPERPSSTIVLPRRLGAARVLGLTLFVFLTMDRRDEGTIAVPQWFFTFLGFSLWMKIQPSISASSASSRRFFPTVRFDTVKLPPISLSVIRSTSTAINRRIFAIDSPGIVSSLNSHPSRKRS